jgi:hypothetical protein
VVSVPLADVRLFLSAGGSRGFERAAQVDVGVMRFGGLMIHPVPAPSYPDDAYLVRASIGLDLEPGFGGPQWAEAGFEFRPADVAVLAAVPQSVRTGEPARTYRIDSRLEFVPAPADEAGDLHLGPQEPVTEAFGIGSSRFRWRWTAPDAGGVAAGTRLGWFVLLVPRGVREIRVRPTARYELPEADTDGLHPNSEPAECVITLPEPELTRGRGRPAITGTTRLAIVRNLGSNWPDLADYLEIPLHERGRFARGDEARALLQWLEIRNRLDELPAALEAIDRSDLL